MDLFLENLPKIELHAHLNGSLNTESIKELGLQLYGDNSMEFLQLCKQFVDFKDTDLDNCFKKFAFMHDLTSTKKGLQLACEMILKDFATDNVIYLELRTTPKQNLNMSRREYLNVVIKTIEQYKDNSNIMVKLIISIDRSQSVEIAEEIINLAVVLRQEFPDIVKGVDLSGNPNVGKFENFKTLLEKAKNSQLKLALHCAEVLNNSETQSMIEFGFDRCGHGTFLTEKQLQECHQQKITIECCLTSNVKCATVKSYDCHHFKNIFKSNIATVLCTDDSGVFNTTLTNEFKMAYKYFSLNKQDIYTLSLNAIKASFSEDSEKEILTKHIDTYFNKFIEV